MEIFVAIALTFFFILPGLVAFLFWKQSRKQRQQELNNIKNKAP